jgi:hypothetical protein
MMKLLKSFFGVKSDHSTPPAWTDESWNAASYENLLSSGHLARAATATGEDDDTMASSSFMDDGPRFNIDGSPMSGGVDIHGNPFGVTSHDFSSATSGPDFNIDGSPMMGDFDIHGNTFGVTDSGSSFDFDSGSSWSSGSDSFGSSSWSDDNHF